jgi:hypothetical protein
VVFRSRNHPAATGQPQFGTVEDFRNDDQLKTAVSASTDHRLVCLLCNPDHPDCHILEESLTELAAHYTSTRFLKWVDITYERKPEEVGSFLVFHKQLAVGPPTPVVSGQDLAPENV